MKLHTEVLQDVVSRCENASCNIMNHNGELLPEEVLSDLQMKIHHEWRNEQFSVESIQALVKYQIFL